MHVNGKWCLFPFAVPSWRHHICVVSAPGSILTLMGTIFPKICPNHCPRMQNVHFRLTCVAQKRLCLSSPIIPSLNLNTDSKTKRIVIDRSDRSAGCLYYRGKCCMDLGISGDQKKCPKWKTCLCYRGSNIHCRISINVIGKYVD